MTDSTHVPVRARRSFRSAVVLIALGLGMMEHARGDLVVLTRGDVLKAESYSIDGDGIEVQLESGGTLDLPLLWVDRIVDDEWAEPVAEAEVPRQLELRFLEGMQAPSVPFGDLILKVSERYQVNPELVGAMIAAESDFRSEAVSIKGARGLMQLMPATAERFGVPSDRLFEPEQNIEAGVRYLDWLIDRFGDQLPLVLSAYNAGEGTVQRYGGVPPFRETQNYILRIYRRLGLSEPESLGQ